VDEDTPVTRLPGKAAADGPIREEPDTRVGCGTSPRQVLDRKDRGTDAFGVTLPLLFLPGLCKRTRATALSSVKSPVPCTKTCMPFPDAPLKPSSRCSGNR
jgi:hypothetical protein